MSNNSFENNLTELDNIISVLESGECSLDEAIKLFENGVKITENCSKQLNEAKLKITELKKNTKDGDNDVI